MAPPATAYARVNETVLRTLVPPGRSYWGLVSFVGLVFTGSVLCWGYMIYTGLGLTGLTHPVGWGVLITNFVFWVGIAHSGTLISAILYLFRARWRNAIYRLAEGMTVIAVMTAGMYPLAHLGRVWKFYWLMPYPNQRELWPNFRSPLVWDVLAVSTYLTVSAVFFFVGLVPDFAVLRDRTTGLRQKIYRILSLGWSGTADAWRNYQAGYLLFAAIATPLVVSVHSVVSWDFAMSVVPGWHSTIFAPYFVAGAIFSGLAMVITLLIPLRKLFRLEEYITVRHFEAMAKVILVTALIVGYSYAVEFFMAWYSGNRFETGSFLYRATGSYAIPFWIMVVCNAILPLAFFKKRVRTSLPALFVISLLINVGMWFERFVIIVSSLAHEYIPYSWGLYRPTWVEGVLTLLGFSWFFLLFLLFVKHLPAVAITEVKETMAPPGREEEAPGMGGTEAKQGGPPGESLGRP